MIFKKKQIGQGRRQPEGAEHEEKTPLRYKRGITLRGGSAYKHSDSPRSKAHQLRARRRQILTLFFGVIVGAGALFWLVSQFTATVVVTSSSAPEGAPSENESYVQAIQEHLNNNPIERLRFLVNQTALDEAVASKTPEVRSVTLSGHGDVATASAYLHFRKPVASWFINQKQYFVDDNGVVFEKNYFAAPAVQIVDESGVTPEQGSTVTSARFLSFIGRVVALSSEAGYEVGEAILPAGTTRQLQLEINDVKPIVIFSIDRGAGEQVSDMVAVLAYLKRHNIVASYIDVRVAGKAVYR